MSLIFTDEEHADRVQRVRKKCVELNVDALLAVGRGGGAVDRYGHVFYLTEAYAGFPTIPDLPGRWTDRGWCAALVTATELIVFGDPDTVAPDAVYGDDLRAGYFFTDMIIDALRPLSRRGARIGIAGADTLTWRQARALSEALYDLKIIDADGVMFQVRAIKSPAEIKALRASGEVGQSVIAASMRVAKSGASEADVGAAAAESIAKAGAAFANVFTGVSPHASHLTHPHIQIPPYSKESIMHPGDMFTIDISAAFNGYFFDIARTKVVDAEPTSEQSALIDLSKRTVDAVADALIPGAAIADATRAGLAVLQEDGYDMTADDGWQALGHGLGIGFEPPYLVAECNDIVQADMVFAVERHCSRGTSSATYERNLIITDSGARDIFPVDAAW